MFGHQRIVGRGGIHLVRDVTLICQSLTADVTMCQLTSQNNAKTVYIDQTKSLFL